MKNLFKKIIICIGTFSSFSLCSFTTNSLPLDLYNEELRIYLNNDKNAYIYDYKKVFFNDNKGYFFKFKNDQEKLNSILIRGNLFSYEVISIYESNFNPINGNNIYYLDPVTFVDKNTFNNQVNTASYLTSDTGVKYEKPLIDPSRYLKIDNIEEKVNENLTLNSSMYDINDVPNYYNSQYDHFGCAPTVGAMYFAYLSNNGYSDLTNGIKYPMYHDDNKTLVDKFIKNIGDNYFNTKMYSEHYSTSRDDLRKGYEKYLESFNYSGYSCYESKNYNELMNSIENCAMPVPTSINSENQGHNVLTYGYFRTSNGDDFIMTNFVANNVSTTITLKASCVICFYFIYK